MGEKKKLKKKKWEQSHVTSFSQELYATKVDYSLIKL